MWNGVTVNQIGLLTNGKQFKKEESAGAQRT